MEDHLHTGIVQLTVTTIFVVLAINVWRIGAGLAAQSDNTTLQRFGGIVGAPVHFGSAK